MIHRIRRSQAVVPFGVGAIVDFRGEALMAAGLHAWPSSPLCRIDDPRLARRLGVDFFRAPPSPDDGRGSVHLPFVRFPLWHVCPWCRGMSKAAWNDAYPPGCEFPFPPGTRKAPSNPEGSASERPKKLEACASRPKSKRVRMVPLRFIVACDEGHIEDFPWIEWAHRKTGEKLSRQATCDDPKLRLLPTGASGLEGLRVTCETCEASQSMALAAGGALGDLGCSGSRPWLGSAGAEPSECSSPTGSRLLQRGASNVYFANVESSILIPPYTSRARTILEDAEIWKQVTDETLGTLEKRIAFLAAAKKTSPEDLRNAYEEKIRAPKEVLDTADEENYRYAEYTALLDTSRPLQDDLRAVHFDSDDFEPQLASLIDRVVLVEKLAETRALVGFSRITPDIAAEAARPKLLQLSLDAGQRWLPAIRVYGEGIFLTLSLPALRAWETQYSSRASQLASRNVDSARRRGRQVRLLPPTFVVLHTLAHLLIRRLSFECGYGSSSLRERIYCREDGEKPPMAGLLIYTAAGDSEGTMGGLVLQGRPGRLEAVIAAALEDARWCSSDPLCMESLGQGTDSLNMAACHACALVPETSCETGNRLLDRESVVGSSDAPERGFMGVLGDQ